MQTKTTWSTEQNERRDKAQTKPKSRPSCTVTDQLHKVPPIPAMPLPRPKTAGTPLDLHRRRVHLVPTRIRALYPTRHQEVLFLPQVHDGGASERARRSRPQSEYWRAADGEVDAAVEVTKPPRLHETSRLASWSLGRPTQIAARRCSLL